MLTRISNTLFNAGIRWQYGHGIVLHRPICLWVKRSLRQSWFGWSLLFLRWLRWLILVKMINIGKLVGAILHTPKKNMRLFGN